MDIKKFENFIDTDVTEAKPIYNNKNIIQELCVCMILINNEFLDRILDKGQSGRYLENSQVFLTDLKSLLISKNRLNLGKFVNNKCVLDDEISIINQSFSNVEFDINKNWDKLVNSRIIARNIIDKLQNDDKLDSDSIRNVFWIGPNKTKDYSEDIVLELNDGKQYSLFINKNSTLTKSASFNMLADDLIGKDSEMLYDTSNLVYWDKLVQKYLKIIYENANKPIQIHIEKFIDPTRIETLKWFDYFNIIHSENKFKFLGEYITEFDKNISKLSDLLNEIWKNRDMCFIDPKLVYDKWMKTKIYILNSRILEHSLTNSLSKNDINDISKLENGFKKADGNLKMKFTKIFVNKLNCLERPLFYFGNNGNNLQIIPSKQYFRDNYENIEINFDYHVKLILDEKEEENNDFKLIINMKLNDDNLIKCEIDVKFSGGLSSKLVAKYNFLPVTNFNNIIENK